MENANALTIGEEYVRVYGLQIKITGCTADRLGISWGVPTVAYPCYFEVAYCIFTATSAANGASMWAMDTQDPDVNAKIYNCLAYKTLGQDSVDGRFIRLSGTNFVYNCTGQGNFLDYQLVGGATSLYNCISQDSLSDGYSGAFSGDYNCSDRASDAPGANSVNSYEVTFVSETAGSEDFHLDSSSTSIIDVTSDQSGGLFSTDLSGVTRPQGAAWDIGANEYEPPASAVSPWRYGRHIFNSGW
jgi:hypothetical protein